MSGQEAGMDSKATTWQRLRREIHRTWFLCWRLPVSWWHQTRMRRHEQLAKRHHAAMVANSRHALRLADQYPSIYQQEEAA